MTVLTDVRHDTFPFSFLVGLVFFLTSSYEFEFLGVASLRTNGIGEQNERIHDYICFSGCLAGFICSIQPSSYRDVIFAVQVFVLVFGREH